MRIVVDLTIVREINKITGIERVAIETLKSLLTNEDYQFEYHILCSKNGYSYIQQIIASINVKKCDVTLYSSPLKNRIFTDQFWMPYTIKKISPDYVYYTTLGIPFIQSCPFSMIIHDAVAWVMPETISRGMKLYYKPLIEKALKSESLKYVMTVSQFSKESISKELSISREKIVVNYLGITNNFSITNCKDSIPEVLEKYNINKTYIVILGTIEPRKNIMGAVDAFSIMKKQYNYDGQLVIVGRAGWSGNNDISKEFSSDIVITGFVDDEDLPVILSNATAFVFPSYYEGFGLPMIEAMYLGVPVISSRVASLPEVGGECCVYFNPHKKEEMAATIFETISNKELLAKLSILGKKRSEMFTWNRHGEIVANTILQGVKNGKR